MNFQGPDSVFNENICVYSYISLFDPNFALMFIEYSWNIDV